MAQDVWNRIDYKLPAVVWFWCNVTIAQKVTAIKSSKVSSKGLQNLIPRYFPHAPDSQPAGPALLEADIFKESRQNSKTVLQEVRTPFLDLHHAHDTQSLVWCEGRWWSPSTDIEEEKKSRQYKQSCCQGRDTTYESSCTKCSLDDKKKKHCGPPVTVSIYKWDGISSIEWQMFTW